MLETSSTSRLSGSGESLNVAGSNFTVWESQRDPAGVHVLVGDVDYFANQSVAARPLREPIALEDGLVVARQQVAVCVEPRRRKILRYHSTMLVRNRRSSVCIEFCLRLRSDVDDATHDHLPAALRNDVCTPAIFQVVVDVE